MRRRHRLMLLVCSACLLLALLLKVRPDQRVEFAWAPGIPLPHTCVSRAWFGVECPGCGLTRSAIHLVHGDWRSSLAAHRLGWLLVLAALVHFPYRILALARRKDFLLHPRLVRGFGHALVFLLIANWLFNVSRSAW
jgi:hypothetical protein